MPNGRINDLTIIRLLNQQIRSVRQNLKPPSQISQNKTKRLKTHHLLNKLKTERKKKDMKYQPQQQQGQTPGQNQIKS